MNVNSCFLHFANVPEKLSQYSLCHTKTFKATITWNLTPYSKHTNIPMFGTCTAQVWFMILLKLVVLHQAGTCSCNLLDLYYGGAQFKSQPKYPEISHGFPQSVKGNVRTAHCSGHDHFRFIKFTHQRTIHCITQSLIWTVCHKINQKNKRICILILYYAIIPVEFL
jgi:hypothetical protein